MTGQSFDWLDMSYQDALSLLTKRALEKRAEPKPPALPKDIVGGAFNEPGKTWEAVKAQPGEAAKGIWNQNPSLMWGLGGAAGGAGLGLLRSAGRKKRDWLQDALTGAVMGGATFGAGRAAVSQFGNVGTEAPADKKPPEPAESPPGAEPRPKNEDTTRRRLSRANASLSSRAGDYDYAKDPEVIAGHKIVHDKKKTPEEQAEALQGTVKHIRKNMPNMGQQLLNLWPTSEDNTYARIANTPNNDLSRLGKFNEMAGATDVPGFKGLVGGHGWTGAGFGYGGGLIGGIVGNRWGERYRNSRALGAAVTGTGLDTNTRAAVTDVRNRIAAGDPEAGQTLSHLGAGSSRPYVEKIYAGVHPSGPGQAQVKDIAGNITTPRIPAGRLSRYQKMMLSNAAGNARYSGGVRPGFIGRAAPTILGSAIGAAIPGLWNEWGIGGSRYGGGYGGDAERAINLNVPKK